MKAEIDDERRAAMCEWARTNGLDPEKIDEWVEVVGDTIRYRELVGTREGEPVWEERKAPLLAASPSTSTACRRVRRAHDHRQAHAA